MDPTQSLIRKLESIATLAPEENTLRCFACLYGRKIVQQREDIVREGDQPTECCLPVEGYLCSYYVTAEGRRQILQFHIPGDIPDLQGLHLAVMDHSLAALVPSKLGLSLTRDYPRLGDLFWRETLIYAAIFRQWMVGIGRKTAHSRMAHLICELLVRLRAVELVEDHAYRLPITQTELGDALGLSAVHVNRVLQDLRGEELITLCGGFLHVLDWDGLKRTGESIPPTFTS